MFGRDKCKKCEFKQKYSEDSYKDENYRLLSNIYTNARMIKIVDDLIKKNESLTKELEELKKKKGFVFR